MTLEEKKQYIESQYHLLSSEKTKDNSQILYNLIFAKNKFNLLNEHQSLYLDVKQFVENYITASDSQDYGYDEILLEKIYNIICFLELKQEISIMYAVKRMYYIRGYDTNDIMQKINKLEMKLAFNERHIFKTIRLWMSSSICALMLTYLLYVIIVSCVLLPAPIESMEIFEVSLKKYHDSQCVNHIMNSFAILTGNDDIKPQIIPIGVKGVLVYCLGVLLFYLLLVNYVFKKIENFIQIK